MRTTQRKVPRIGHWRRQRCGPGLSEIRRVHVRGTEIVLARDDVDQLGLLDDSPPPSAAERVRPKCGPARSAAKPSGPVRYSYWRNQPFGPRRSLRRMTLIDVRA